ncbi:mannose-6-phosphate isomerase [Vibrio ishigakensis]|uniref:Mannose-6-phosphate isomerase n=1 Tax=Vibrio ishigakensis TaxID=1481914 RepID=A0A0B8QDS9_9VIBR|nr:mannose-6-phosphate isomerase [Vibrio ishigakensis]
MTIYKLNNVIQNYAWGSKTSINELFGIPNPDDQPQAEIWMGAHPNGCSKLAESDQLLSELISADPESVLGQYTQNRFGELPYLFKVLAAYTPLSIQVHPSKQKAELGFYVRTSKAFLCQRGIETTKILTISQSWCMR